MRVEEEEVILVGLSMKLHGYMHERSNLKLDLNQIWILNESDFE